jgi:hypothetical protein
MSGSVYPDSEKIKLGTKIYLPRITFSPTDFIPDRCGILFNRDSLYLFVRCVLDEDVIYKCPHHEYQIAWFTQKHYDWYSCKLSRLSIMNQKATIEKWCKDSVSHEKAFILQVLKSVNSQLWLELK